MEAGRVCENRMKLRETARNRAKLRRDRERAERNSSKTNGKAEQQSKNRNVKQLQTYCYAVCVASVLPPRKSGIIGVIACRSESWRITNYGRGSSAGISEET